MSSPLVIAASILFALADNGGALLAPREIEFPFEDDKRLVPGESRAGKIWRSHGLPDDGREVPLVIIVHGIIFDGLRHHWLTPDPQGPWDARPFLEDLVDEGRVEPLVAAVPSQTLDATDPGKLFVDIDYDAFIVAVDKVLAPHQRVDRTRVVVMGHSGSACDPESAAFAALRAKTFKPRALIAVDGCMSLGNAQLLATTEGARDVIVSYQEPIWSERPFAEFRAIWDRELAGRWPGGLRVLEKYEMLSENAHLELVEATTRRWLPILLPPTNLAWPAVARMIPADATLAIAFDLGRL